MDHKILPCEIKAAGDGGEFTGHANAFHNIDSAGEIVAVGAFIDSLPEFLQVGFIGGLNHDWNMPIGKPMEAREDSKGLYVRGKISETAHGKDVKILLKDSVIKKMSIGYQVQGSEYLETADDVAAYWKSANYTPNSQDIARAQYGARLLTKVHLYEFSPVTVAANFLADITGVKRYNPSDLKTKRDWEEAVRDALQLSRKQAVAFVSHGFKGLQRDADEDKTTDTETHEQAAITPQIEAEPIVEAKQEENIPLAVALSTVPQDVVRSLYSDFLTRQASHYATR